MPIKAENRARYPSDWGAIRLSILERARYRCEHPGCGAKQYSVGRWICWGGGPHEWRPITGNVPSRTAADLTFDCAGEGLARDGSPWTYGQARAFIAAWAWEEDTAPIVIVLTVAHLDHVPEHCDPSNLRALCQRHHLAHDQDHHQANAAATRRARLGNLELFP